MALCDNYSLENSTHAPRILYIDAYDSFAENIISLIITSLRDDSTRKYPTVTKIRHDDPRFLHNFKAFCDFLRNFDAVVAGPGPGNPTVPDDVGIIRFLWKLESDSLLPVLGVCLGFQSLCYAFGAEVSYGDV